MQNDSMICRNEGLQALAKLLLLESISLEGIGDADIKILSRLTNLQFLHLSRAFGEEQLYFFTNLQKLEHVDFRLCAPDSWEFASHLTNLKSFDFENNNFNENSAINDQDLFWIC